MRSLPLLPPARPVHLTVHPSKAMLVVACQGSDKLWEMRCMHPVTGALSSCLIMPHHLSHRHFSASSSRIIFRPVITFPPVTVPQKHLSSSTLIVSHHPIIIISHLSSSHHHHLL